MPVSNKANTSRRGKAAKTPLEVAQGVAVRALISQTEIKNEIEEKLRLNGETDSSRKQEVEEILQDRMAIGKQIATILDKKKEVNAHIKTLKKGSSQEKAEKAKVEKLKQQEKGLYDHLFDLPKLGYTQAEFNALDPEDKDKKRPLGRPGITEEIEYVRAQEHYANSVKELRKIERTEDIDTPYDVESEAQKEIERRAAKGENKYLTKLDNLDKEIRLIDKKIKLVETGKDLTGSTSKSENGKELGRTRRTVEEKIADLQDKKNLKLKTISQIEEVLDEPTSIQRKINVLRHEARVNKMRSNKAKGAQQKKLLNKYIELRDQAEALVAKLKTLKPNQASTQKESESNAVETVVAKEEVIDKEIPSTISDSKPANANDGSYLESPEFQALTEEKLQELEAENERMVRTLEAYKKREVLKRQMVETMARIKELPDIPGV